MCSAGYLVRVRGVATEGSNEADAWQFPLSSGPSLQQQALWHLNFFFLFQKDQPRERLSLIWLLKSSQKAKFFGKLSLSCHSATFSQQAGRKECWPLVKGKQKGVFLCGCLCIVYCFTWGVLLAVKWTACYSVQLMTYRWLALLVYSTVSITSARKTWCGISSCGEKWQKKAGYPSTWSLHSIGSKIWLWTFKWSLR